MGQLIDGAAERITLERGFLGGLLWSPARPLPAVLATHFRLGKHREVWLLFEQLAEAQTPREAPLVIHALCKAGWLHVDAASWVGQAMEDGVHCVAFDRYAQILQAAS